MDQNSISLTFAAILSRTAAFRSIASTGSIYGVLLTISGSDQRTPEDWKGRPLVSDAEPTSSEDQKGIQLLGQRVRRRIQERRVGLPLFPSRLGSY